MADRNDTVSVGAGVPNIDGATFTRQIVNVKAGTQGTDAVNLNQLNAAIANVSVGDNPYVSITTGAYAAAAPAVTNGNSATAIGGNASATGISAVALGGNTIASGQSSMALGTLAQATSLDATAVGIQAFATGNAATALGRLASAGGNNSTALGDRASTSAAHSVALGNASIANRENSVSVGRAGAERQITNVAAGTQNTDAVNVNQLSGVVGALGGGAKVNPDGSIEAPSYSLADPADVSKQVEYGNVGDALSNLDGRVTGNTGDIADLRDKLADSGLVDPVTGKAVAAVTYDRNADGTPNYGSVTLGNGVDPTQIKNVADGVDRHDAINLGQLQDAGLVGDDGSGNLTSAALTYDKNADGSVNHDKATLAGTDGTILSNVKAGVADMDAVNVAQLKGSGLIGDDGKAIAAVTYDRNADGTPNYGSATLGNGTGPTQVKNVAAGVAATDAVNVQQMQQAVATGNPYIGGRGTGVAAQATGINAVALGLGSVANEINTISVGNGTTGLQRRITNVQNGQADSDAATVGQVNELLGVTSTTTQAAISDIDTKTRAAIQDVNSRLDTINTTASADPYVQVDGAGDGSDNAFAGAGTFGVAIGAEASATGTTAIAVGAQSVSSGTGSIALGAGASAVQTGAIAVGSSRATGSNALALGNGSAASGNNSVAEGFNAQAAGLNALAFGNTSRANAADSMAFGTTAQVDPLATNSIAIGRAANVTSVAQNSVALGSNSVADRLNSISVGSNGQQRQIIYVARGTANTDAVNVSQLKDAMAAFGGDAAVGADGSITNPTYTIGGNTYRNVGDALNALAQSGGGGGTDPLAVTYGTDASGAPNFEVVALKGTDGTTLSNVKAGVADMDAVNVSQLKGSGLIGDDGKSIAAVTYDRNADGTPNYGSVSLGNGVDPTQLKNVADATDDGDATNLGQLKKAGLVGDDGAGNLTSAAVVYDKNADGSVNHDKVTLAGTDGTTLSNVKAGVADMDAVNVSQLKGSGLIGDDGKSIAAVTYDRNADGTPNYGSVSLGNGVDPTQLKNVADATDDGDATNLGQLKKAGLVGDDGAGNLTSAAVVYDKNADGSVNHDKVTLAGTDGTTLSNVKSGVADTDAVNVSQLKGSGLIGDDGKSIAAVTYDRNADGTPNYGSVSLGNGVDPTQLKNVADATDDGDATNLGQLKKAGLVGDDGSGNLTSLAVTYDDATKDSVTLGGASSTTPVALHNVADGVLSATSKDAVNGSQLFATNQNLSDLKDSLEQGGVVDPTTGESLAVVYDSATKNSVTLGNAGTPVGIHNVAAGAVSATSNDAINGSQLYNVSKSVADKIGGGAGVGADGSITDPTYSVGGQDYHSVGDALGALDKNSGSNPLAVAYDSAAKDTVTLGGTGATPPVALKNVADATDDSDALNLGQLKSAGLIGDDGSGNLTSAAVVYDKNADGSVNRDRVTLAGTDGTTLSNVKSGVADTDAVNVSQLKGSGLIGDDGKSIAAVTYDRNADGTPNYGSVSLGNGVDPTQLKNVADATDDGDATNLGQLKKAGLVGDDGAGNLTSAAVVYDKNADGTVNHDKVTLAGTDGTTLSNVKSGVADMDAVNVSQLKGSGLIGDDGKAIAAVTYDRNADGTPNYGSVSLGNGVDPTQLKNVADATDDGDATNLGQLKKAGLVGDDGAGNLTSAAVTYDKNADGSVNRDKVTLAGTNGTILSNVKSGVADTDAVNVSQLKGSGLIGDDGKSIAAVTYDRNADGTPNYGSVSLGGAGATAPVALKNVADGVDRHDAINLGQLQDAGLVAPIDPTNPGAGLTSTAVTYDKHADGSANFDQITLAGTDGTTITHVKAGSVTDTSTDAVNGAQLHGVSQSVADALGGGSTVGADGTVTNPSYSLADATDPSKQVAFDNVGDALSNLDGRTVTNTKNITVINQQLADSGLVDPVTGQSIAAVTYDRNADGTPNLGSVTLGGAHATAPVALKNVADGVDSHDAVNLGQLQNAGLVTPVDPTDPGKGVKSLAVTYDNAAQDLVTLKGAGGTTLSNVKAGVADMDAVNVSQLKGSGLIGDDGKSIAAVTYNRNADGTPNYGAVTLGNGMGPTQIKNVADATDDTDAVNLKQLKDAGLVAPVDPTDPGKGVMSLAVTYDDAAQDHVTLKGAGGTTLSNVKAGVADMDAVNVSQLKGSGLIGDDGKAIAAVTYDDATKSTVTFGGTGAAAPVALKNVAQGVDGTDAVNVDQMTKAIRGVTGPGNPLAVEYDTIGMNRITLGGLGVGGAMGPAVTITNVADGKERSDAVNFGQLSDLSDRIGGIDDRVGKLEVDPGNGGGGGGGGTGSQYFAGTDTDPATNTNPASAGTGTGNVAAGSGANIGGGANNGTAIGSGSVVSKDNGVAIGSGANSSGAGSTAIGQGSKASGDNSVALGSGSVATEANTVSFGNGTDEGNRRIVNIADGQNATDAATKGQLDRAMGGMQGQVNDLSRNAYSGIAAATALTMIPGVDPGKTVSFGIGGATYKGYQAVAFGGEARITQNLKMKAGVGMSSGGNTVGVGASYQW
ncbi:beta strand repeat-containing protein [Burkholderia cenocepacia]|uniref:beta strand repeat-containing protein n=1 Tax=Burkholderia cenocepacia TaxID=95486 RepID=UPI0039F0DDE4